MFLLWDYFFPADAKPSSTTLSAGFIASHCSVFDIFDAAEAPAFGIDLVLRDIDAQGIRR